MGLFDKLKKFTKQFAEDIAEDIGLNEPYAEISRPDNFFGVDTKAGGFVFETTKYMHLVSVNEPGVDFCYNVSFGEDDFDELNKASIYVEDDFTTQQQDSMQNFTKLKVNNRQPFFERVTYSTAPRTLPGISIGGKECMLSGKSYTIYRFQHGGKIKNLVLSIPDDCPDEEAEYAKNALELVASTLNC